MSNTKDNTTLEATAPLESHENDFNAYMSEITRPREPIEAQTPPFEQRAASSTGDNEDLTDNDAENLDLLQYNSEHRDTAIFALGIIDNGMGWIGSMISGENPEKYMRFADGKKHPDYLVDVTAALVKKYHAKMSLEGMFITALFMIYGPMIPTAMQDRKKVLRNQNIQEQAAYQAAYEKQLKEDAKAEKTKDTKTD